MFTIFTVPRPFEGYMDLIQRNALMSWKILKGSPQIILLGKGVGVQEFCELHGMDFLPNVKYSTQGVLQSPFVNDVFNKAQEKSGHNVMAFVNTDIILMNDFVDVLIQVSKKFDDFLLVGQKYDIDIRERIDFKDSLWEQNLRNKIKSEGKLHASCGIDYHVFKKGFWSNIPPFVIGRSAYDNWLISQALGKECIVIDGTKAICIAHQQHEHGKLENGSNILGGSEAIRNRELAGNIQQGFTSNATWEVVFVKDSNTYQFIERSKNE